MVTTTIATIVEELEVEEAKLLARAKEMIRFNENHPFASKGFEFADFRQVEILRHKVRELDPTQE